MGRSCSSYHGSMSAGMYSILFSCLWEVDGSRDVTVAREGEEGMISVMAVDAKHVLRAGRHSEKAVWELEDSDW